jgi:hypothetical protein
MCWGGSFRKQEIIVSTPLRRVALSKNPYNKLPLGMRPQADGSL